MQKIYHKKKKSIQSQIKPSHNGFLTTIQTSC